MMAWVQAQTGSFAMGYYLMALFMFSAGLLVLTLKYKVNGTVKKMYISTRERIRHCTPAPSLP